MNGKRLIPLLFVLLSVLACYAPVLFATYGIADDFPCLSGNWLGPTMDSLGRSLGGALLTWSYGALGGIPDLRYLRLLSVLGIGLLAALILKHLTDRGAEPYLAAAVTVLIVTLPPFQVYAAWAQVWYYAFTAAATYVSYRWLRNPTGLRALAAVALLVLALNCYQPAAMFFWFWIAVDLFYTNFRRPAAPLGAFAAALLVYLAIYKLRGFQSPRSELDFNLFHKLGWFAQDVLPPTFRLQAFNLGSRLIEFAAAAR